MDCPLIGYAQLSETFKAEITKGTMPGAVLLVARRGKVAHFETLGLRDPQTNEAMSGDAIFRLASMTKPFVSAPLRPRCARVPPKRFGGGGAMVASASDYARFCQMLLNGGELEGVRILFALGIVLRTSGRLPDNAPSTLNGFVVNVSLPALTLVTVHALEPDPTLVLSALMAWVLFGIGVAFFWLVGRLLKLSRATIGALIWTGSLANTSFIGLPMIETWYGSEFLGAGIIIDQLGAYFVLSTLGVIAAGCIRRVLMSMSAR